MLNTLAPRKLMNVDIGEFRYPLARRDRVPAATPFGALKDDLISTLFVPADDDPVSLFRHYAHNMKQLETLVEETNRFVQVAATVNGFKQYLMMAKVIRPPSPGIELGTQQPTIIRDTFNSLLAGQVNQYVRNLAHALDQAVESKQIGLISWQGDKAARYSWYSLQVIERQTDERKRTMISQEKVQGGTNHRTEHVTERDKETVYRLSLRIDDVLDAEKHPLPADSVLKTAKVKRVLDAAPETLRRHLLIVDGTQIRDIKAEMDIKTERWTETDIQVVNRFEPEEVTVVRYDPCLCLGHYCIIGWGEAELAPERRRIEEEQRLAAIAQARAEANAQARAQAKADLRMDKKGWQEAIERSQGLCSKLETMLAQAQQKETFYYTQEVNTWHSWEFAASHLAAVLPHVQKLAVAIKEERLTNWLLVKEDLLKQLEAFEQQFANWRAGGKNWWNC